jgi:U5 small nuclear ribonucleoprotein component
VVGEHSKSIERMVAEFGVYLRSSSYGQDVKPLLKEVCTKIFGSATGACGAGRPPAGDG